jgi:penicillin-binding protein 1A
MNLRTVALTFFLSLCAAACAGILFVVNHISLETSMLHHYDTAQPTILLDHEGVEWARFQIDRREPVDFQQLPRVLIDAFVATEDHTFFKHRGISWRAIIRSTLVNLYHQKKMQGASTITQQLVKMLLADTQKTWTRKLKEQWLAIMLERSVTKEQIFQAYINHIYFGCGIYGVQAASQRFWGKSVEHLEPHEAATLAAIVQSPNRYCPLVYPLSAKKRRNVVLHSMYLLGSIDAQTYERERKMPMELYQSETDCIAPHLKETIRAFLENLYGKHALYTKGFAVQTTLHREKQTAAQKIFSEQIAHMRARLQPQIDGAFVCCEGATGAIAALIGGADFKVSQFNRAVQARRQFGSVFKPYIYAAALTTGVNFAQTEIDEPFQLEQNGVVWQPKNDNDKFFGQMTLARALSRSNNIVTIKTLLKVGYAPLYAMVQKLHLSAPFRPYPSLALGCVDGTVLEAVGMFNVFAHHGQYVEPHYITWIKDNMGNRIWKYRPIKERIMEARIADQVAKVLSIGLTRYLHNNSSRLAGVDAFGKTGTTNDSRTCWFAGATPEYTTAIYLGCDDNSPLGANIYAVRTAFPIWLTFYESMTTAMTRSFSYDPSLHQVTIDSTTGAILDAHDTAGISILV